MSEPARRRRHGEQLESALLAAAWDELVEVGYARLTTEAVAARARTGIAVLYRRWANKDQLVLAAIEHHRNGNPIAVPDTGSLRTDLLAHLTALSEALAGFFAIAAAAAFSGLLADTGLTPSQARDKVMDAQRLPRVRILYQRAHARGEINLQRIPPAVLAMPFDLVRHDMLMELEPLKPARIQSIVDELFLPLVQSHQAGQALSLPQLPRARRSRRDGDEALAELNDVERAGWAWLVTRRRVTAVEYEEAFGLPRRTALNHLKRLTELGLVRKRGAGPATRYEPVNLAKDRTAVARSSAVNRV